LLRVCVLLAVTMSASRFVLPQIFRRVARLPELVMVGAIGWCFMVGEFAEWLHLSREMGALIAGVALSTFPYALDVTAKVTSLRDFFVTLFFVGLGMKIRRPDVAVVGAAVVFALFVIGSRLATTFLPLYRMRQGLRASLLPAINLAQISEFSLVLLELGAAGKFNHVSPLAKDLTSVAFVLLAASSTFGMARSDGMVRWLVPRLKRFGLRDLDETESGPAAGGEGHGHGARILILGFHRVASSLLSEIEQESPDLLKEIGVVDFNPVVHERLQARGVRVTYGDISRRDTIAHVGVGEARIIVCTIPDSLLKGITNERLVRTLREMNPTARILVPAEQVEEVPTLVAAGASHVCLGRVLEGRELLGAIRAADEGLIDSMRDRLLAQVAVRREIL
jgi:voltage-gated potassium channel Kch